jgi:hypothetical protein
MHVATFTAASQRFQRPAGLDDAPLRMWPGPTLVRNYEAAAGLVPRPLGQTIHETLQHELLLARWHARPHRKQGVTAPVPTGLA